VNDQSAEELLRALTAGGVRYVLVGGLAVNVHGVIRSTKDVHICPDPRDGNLAALAALLGDLEATQIGIEDFDPVEMPFDPTRVEDLAQGGNFRLSTRLGMLDVMQWLSGVPGDLAYPVLAADAVCVELDGIELAVCSLKHLRAMKRAAGRPQDLQDLADLAIAHPDEPD
jgi:predicted nucleotidyltransferase